MFYPKTKMVEHGDHIFLHQDVRNIFPNKTVVVLGDSIQRSVYKDLVCLWYDSSSRYLTEPELRGKGELSCLGDKLLSGGQLGERVNGVQYKEVREFREQNTVFRFYFITRCFNDYVLSVLNEFKTLKPDIIIMNSCYWDVHHYGEEGMKKYKENLEKLFSSVCALPSHPLLLWNAALPLAEQCKGGFLRQGFKTLPRNHVLWANNVARELLNVYRFIYVDLFFTLDGNQFFTQAADGIHWGKRAHRKISNSILTAICRRLSISLPIARQLSSASNPTFPERFIGHSWPEYKFPELDYYDQLQRNLNLNFLTHDRYRPTMPKPLLGLEIQPNFIPLNHYSFYTPPPPAPIARYIDTWPLDLTPQYRIGNYIPNVGYQLPRYFSEPLPPRKRKLPTMPDHYKKRFDKMKPIIPMNNQTKSDAPGTPLSTRSSETTTVSESAVKNSENMSNNSPSSSNSKLGDVESVNEGNKDNSENIDVTNNQDAKPEKAITGADETASCAESKDSVGAMKRKRDDEEDVESCPPQKQVKQVDGTPVKQLHFDSFL